MPRLVDHEARRAEIVESTWRLIARNGFAATTMRDIAEEMGVAHGALSHYFASKDDLLLASYEHVFERTDRRFAARRGRRRGLRALRLLAEEMMPLADEQRLEARIVMPFWERSATSARFAAVHAEGMDRMAGQFEQFLHEAVADGEAVPHLDVRQTAKNLLSMLTGLQILAVLMAQAYSPTVQRRMLRDFLADGVESNGA